jgi:hypothetical protein
MVLKFITVLLLYNYLQVLYSESCRMGISIQQKFFSTPFSCTRMTTKSSLFSTTPPVINDQSKALICKEISLKEFLPLSLRNSWCYVLRAQPRTQGLDSRSPPAVAEESPGYMIQNN